MMIVFFCQETHQIYLRSTNNNLSAVSLKPKSDGLWQTKKKITLNAKKGRFNADSHTSTFLCGENRHWYSPCIYFRLRKNRCYPGKYILYDRHAILPSKY